MRQLLTALAFLHDTERVHRDVKVSGVLVMLPAAWPVAWLLQVFPRSSLHGLLPGLAHVFPICLSRSACHLQCENLLLWGTSESAGDGVSAPLAPIARELAGGPLPWAKLGGKCISRRPCPCMSAHPDSASRLRGHKLLPSPSYHCYIFRLRRLRVHKNDCWGRRRHCRARKSQKHGSGAGSPHV